MHHCPLKKERCKDVDKEGNFIKQLTCWHCCERGHDLEHCPNQSQWEYWRICFIKKEFYKSRQEGRPFVGILPGGGKTAPATTTSSRSDKSKGTPSPKMSPASPSDEKSSGPATSYEVKLDARMTAIESTNAILRKEMGEVKESFAVLEKKVDDNQNTLTTQLSDMFGFMKKNMSNTSTDRPQPPVDKPGNNFANPPPLAKPPSAIDVDDASSSSSSHAPTLPQDSSKKANEPVVPTADDITTTSPRAELDATPPESVAPGHGFNFAPGDEVWAVTGTGVSAAYRRVTIVSLAEASGHRGYLVQGGTGQPI